eukprot:451507_1
MTNKAPIIGRYDLLLIISGYGRQYKLYDFIPIDINILIQLFLKDKWQYFKIGQKIKIKDFEGNWHSAQIECHKKSSEPLPSSWHRWIQKFDIQDSKINNDNKIWGPDNRRNTSGINIGKNNIIQPGVVITPKKGRIIIGDNNVIADNVTIINNSTKDMIIGNGNVFECRSRIEALKIGNFNRFETKCHIMKNVVIGNGAVIGPKVIVIMKKKVKDNTLVYANNMFFTQPLMKKRNKISLDTLTEALTKIFYNEFGSQRELLWYEAQKQYNNALEYRKLEGIRIRYHHRYKGLNGCLYTEWIFIQKDMICECESTGVCQYKRCKAKHRMRNIM